MVFRLRPCIMLRSCRARTNRNRSQWGRDGSPTANMHNTPSTNPSGTPLELGTPPASRSPSRQVSMSRSRPGSAKGAADLLKHGSQSFGGNSRGMGVRPLSGSSGGRPRPHTPPYAPPVVAEEPVQPESVHRRFHTVQSSLDSSGGMAPQPEPALDPRRSPEVAPQQVCSAFSAALFRHGRSQHKYADPFGEAATFCSASCLQ